MVWLFALLPFVSTLLGGWAVLHLQHRLHPIMAFAAGVLVATALANLLPESFGLFPERPALVGGLAVAGYLLFAALETQLHRYTWEHEHDPATSDSEPHEHPRRYVGLVGAGWMILHSLLDGLAIGAGFSAGNSVGLVVGIAVLAHDFADGMNVTTLALERSRGAALAMLALDALAPPIGAFLGMRLAPPDALLGVLLAVFAGAFLALGAGHLLPEAHHHYRGGRPTLALAAFAGAALVLVVRQAIP